MDEIVFCGRYVHEIKRDIQYTGYLQFKKEKEVRICFELLFLKPLTAWVDVTKPISFDVAFDNCELRISINGQRMTLEFEEYVFLLSVTLMAVLVHVFQNNNEEGNHFVERNLVVPRPAHSILMGQKFGLVSSYPLQ